MGLSYLQPALGLRLHLPVPFTCCRHRARRPRLPVAKERFPLVVPVHEIIHHSRILDPQLPNHGLMIKVTTAGLPTEYYNLVPWRAFVLLWGIRLAGLL